METKSGKKTKQQEGTEHVWKISYQTDLALEARESFEEDDVKIGVCGLKRRTMKNWRSIRPGW